MESNRGSEERLLKMEIVTKECTKMTGRLEREHTLGQMDQLTKEISKEVSVWAWEY